MERIETGCKELDDMLRGGVPKGSSLLITGPSGTYKSSLAYSILVHQGLKEKKSVHILVEQFKDSFLDQIESMNLNTQVGRAIVTSLSEMLYGDRGFGLRDVEEGSIDKHTEETIKRLGDLIKKEDYDLVVFDSLNAFSDLMLQSSNPYKRGWMRDLFDRLHIPKGLSIIISEWTPGITEGPEKYLADGVLRTFRRRYAGTMSVEMVCEKMRGTNAERYYCGLDFIDGEFSLIGPHEIIPDMEESFETREG